MEPPEFKLIHAINFKCISCKKKYATEDSVKKHIRKIHDVQNPTSLHYESFVGVKKTKIPTSPSVANPQPTKKSLHQVDHQQGSGSSSTAGLAYNCDMCEKLFQSFGGLKNHLTKFHDVTCAINTDMYSVSVTPAPLRPSRPPRPPPAFVSPFVATTGNEVVGNIVPSNSEIGPSGPSDSKSGPSEGKNPVKMQQTPSNKSEQKKKQIVSKKIENPDTEMKKKRKSNIGFCQTLSNMFRSGNIKSEKISRWGKNKLQTSQAQCLNNNTKPTKSSLAQSFDCSIPQLSSEKNQPDLSVMELDMSDAQLQGDMSDAQLQGDMADAQLQGDMSDDQVRPNKSDDQVQHEVSVAQVLRDKSDKQIPHNKSDEQVQQDLSDAQVQLDELEIQAGRSEVQNVKVKNQKRRKSCDQPDCEPCAFLTDCLVCKYCINRHLK